MIDAIFPDRRDQKADILSVSLFVRSSVIAKIKQRTSCPHSQVTLWLADGCIGAGVTVPAAAERGVQRGGVGQAGGAGLDQRDARVLVVALRLQQVEIAGGADPVLALGLFAPGLLSTRVDMRGLLWVGID